MVSRKKQISPYLAMEVLSLCVYPHHSRYLIEGKIDSINELAIMGAISQGEEFCCQRTFTDILHLSRPMVTKIIAGLEAKGLIMRDKDEDDLRGKKITFTKEGKVIVEWLADRMARYEAILTKGISEEDLEHHAKITLTMIENLLNVPERELKKMPSFEEYKGSGDNTPQIISAEDQHLYLYMIRKIERVNSEK